MPLVQGGIDLTRLVLLGCLSTEWCCSESTTCTVLMTHVSPYAALYKLKLVFPLSDLLGDVIVVVLMVVFEQIREIVVWFDFFLCVGGCGRYRNRK